MLELSLPLCYLTVAFRLWTGKTGSPDSEESYKMYLFAIWKNQWRSLFGRVSSVQFSSVTQLCLTLCNPMDCTKTDLPVHHQLPEFTQSHVHWVGDAIQPSVVPSIRVFSNESVLCIRWPKYWSFSFSIRPSNEYSGLISFSMDWLDLSAVQRTLKSLL